jgi:hypothetical protein
MTFSGEVIFDMGPGLVISIAASGMPGVGETSAVAEGSLEESLVAGEEFSAPPLPGMGVLSDDPGFGEGLCGKGVSVASGVAGLRIAAEVDSSPASTVILIAVSMKSSGKGVGTLVRPNTEQPAVNPTARAAVKSAVSKL